ncbi:MAG: flagellar basal body L-ring protein FlgH [Chromatiales bacterium]|nr:flagellar basal body L-ring protein FlgH [Chromatiales bacterium]
MLITVVLAGCQSAELRPDPAYAAARPVAIPAPAVRDGAIYKAGWDIRLFEDRRARRVGDILTVELTESTAATKSATTTTSKASSIAMTNPTLLGAVPQFSLGGLAAALPLSKVESNNLNVDQSSEQDFSGAGTSAQSNSLDGFISVTVAEVLPNGNLVVRGEKLLNLNRGQEHLRLSGIVRPEDIAPDNTVPSTRIANVGISFSGSGEVADASTLGWITRFFLSAFWPF